MIALVAGIAVPAMIIGKSKYSYLGNNSFIQIWTSRNPRLGWTEASLSIQERQQTQA